MGKKCSIVALASSFRHLMMVCVNTPNMVQGLNFEYPGSLIVSVNEREISAVYEKKARLKGKPTNRNRKHEIVWAGLFSTIKFIKTTKCTC